MEMRIKNVPKELNQKFKILCIKQGITMNEKLLEAIQRIVTEEGDDD